VTDIKLDSITGNITHIGGKKLLEPISMIDWSNANQKYAQICSDYIESTYKAQENFKELSTKTDLMRLVKQHSGQEILERLQEEKGFNLVIVRPTEKWEEPGYEEPKPEGKVHLNNLRRVEIVVLATNLLKKRIGNRKPRLIQEKRGCALRIEEIVKECRKQLEFKTHTNTRVKGVAGSNDNWLTDNIDEYYIESIPDILMEEGWKTYGVPDLMVPDTNHPFWEAYK